MTETRSNQAPISRLFACAALLLLPWVTPAVSFAGPDHGGSPLSDRAFRPGSAAAPFGWATTIADFDADGAPDVAVADRWDPPGGSHYQIEVHLSKGATQRVSFMSAVGALHVIAIDVDQDHDADLVVTPVLSRKIVGLWLNDGAGHFDRREASGFHLPAATLNAANLEGLPDQLMAIVTPERRTIAATIPASIPALLSPTLVGLGTLVFLVREASQSLASPRAPPVPHS